MSTVMPIGQWRESSTQFPNCDVGRPVLGRQNRQIATNNKLSFHSSHWNPTWQMKQSAHGQNNNLMDQSRPTSVGEYVRPCLPVSVNGEDIQPEEQIIVSGILEILKQKTSSQSTVDSGIETAMNSMTLGPNTVSDNGRMEWYGNRYIGGYCTPNGQLIHDSVITRPGFGTDQMANNYVVNESLSRQHGAANNVPFWDSRNAMSPIQEPNGNVNSHWNYQLQGNNHNARLSRQPFGCRNNDQARIPPSKYATDPNHSVSQGEDRTKWYHCEICDCKVNSLYQLKIHDEGVKHRKRLAGRSPKTFNVDRTLSWNTHTVPRYQTQTTVIPTGEQDSSFPPVNCFQPSPATNNFADSPIHANPSINGLFLTTPHYHATTNGNSWHSTVDVNHSVTRDESQLRYDAMSRKSQGYDSDSQYGSDDESQHSGCSGIQHA